jgi:hypothetical protein
MVVRGHWSGARDVEPVSSRDALNATDEASAPHALPLQMARFLSGGNRYELEIVDQDLELTRFLFTIQRERLQLRKERT